MPLNKKKKKKTGPIVVIVLVVLMLLLLLTVYLLFLHFYNKTNYIPDEKSTAAEEAGSEEAGTEEAGTEYVPEDVQKEVEEYTLSPEDMSEIDKNTSDTDPIPSLGGVYSVLLIGSDRRDSGWYGNSDAMILFTINENTKKIYMTSFMRDMYANIPGYGGTRLNSAYALAGPTKLVDTIEQNYGVKIDNYASVDFDGLKAIVDALGGLDIEIKDYELPVFASYGITSPGTYHLNGAEVLSYVRIRRYGYYDFERTQRQRRVMNLIMEKIRAGGVFQLPSTMDALLPYVTHNISQGQMLKLMSGAGKYMKYPVEEYRVPEDGSYYEVNYILIPNDMGAVISGIRSRIYAK